MTQTADMSRTLCTSTGRNSTSRTCGTPERVEDDFNGRDDNYPDLLKEGVDWTYMPQGSSDDKAEDVRCMEDETDVQQEVFDLLIHR